MSAGQAGTARNRRVAARLWWWLLPCAGSYAYSDGWLERLRWLPGNVAWELVRRLPGSEPFEPMPTFERCECDECRSFKVRA